MNRSPDALANTAPIPSSFNRSPDQALNRGSPGHSPEPSVHSMPGATRGGAGLDRTMQGRISVASHAASQSPTRLGLGGGYTGPGRPGGPSGGTSGLSGPESNPRSPG